MTREEAVRRIREGLGYQYSPPAETFVDSAVAVGLLKLDKPKSIEDRVIDVLHKAGKYKGNCLPPGEVLETLDLAGLKIVEK